MKIEWLNDAQTRALITKGWFRKVQAEVICWEPNYGYWKFTNGAKCGTFLQDSLNSARKAAPWEPVRPLPKAKVV